MNLKFSTLIQILTATVVLSACSKSDNSALNFDRDHEHEGDFYLAEPDTGKSSNDPLRKSLSQFFLVEQFNVQPLGSMSNAFKNNPPAGILFWNGNKADALALRETISTYSQQAEALGLQPLLFSTDYEGGGDSLAPSGKSIPGVQRFVKGFTPLAHPRWLGQSMKTFGKELCALHGRIMARELKSVGINYPLSVIGDLATQSLTSVRGISKSAEEVSQCLQLIYSEVSAAEDLIFVTKHFPGLGLTNGDTHDGSVVSDITDQNVLAKHLLPFTDLFYLSENLRRTSSLSVMTTHAKFLAFDTENLTTESSKIVNDLLKSELGFKGIVVSDAMWMGEYGTMPVSQLMPVYLNSFLSGIDLLMIPGARFATSVNYFRKVYDGSLSEEEKALLTARTGLSWPETQARFRTRVQQSYKSLSHARKAIQPAHKGLKEGLPSSLTVKETSRYREILAKLRVATGQ